MLVFAIREEVTTVDAIVLLLLFVAWIAYVAVRECRETATFRNLEIVEELVEDDDESEAATSDPARAQAVSTMSLFERQGRFSGWLNVGLGVLSLGGIIIGAAT